MTQNIQAIRGMNDILPDQTGIWQFIETTLQHLAISYGYREIRFPLLEKTELFKRSIGEVTDIIEKEMYTFEDRNGDSLSLRPEGTASCARACIQNGLLYNQVQKLWYLGPFYRHERPQKGRYRQFHQMGIEAYGISTPDIDAEIIALSARLFKTFGLEKEVCLQINSMGSMQARNQYREILVEYFSKHQAELDEDSQRRLTTNPLRILDSKNPKMHELISNAPMLIDHLDAESKNHFEKVLAQLDQLNINYEINPTIVRGLDYYNSTVFEWVTNKLGAQGTVCAGGRYDGLAEQLSSKPTPAFGFALGLERLVALLEAKETLPQDPQQVDIYVIVSGEAASQQALAMVEALREKLPHKKIMLNCGNSSMKSQFKKADSSGAYIALILGDSEIEQNQITIKYLREKKNQETLPLAELSNHIN